MAGRSANAILCGVAVALVAGCGREGEGLPVACTEGEAAVRQALTSAPRDVSIDGTPLSDCLSDTTNSGELQQVGVTFLGVAADLAAEARARPEGQEATQLGYLIGALRRSAAGAQGVGAELERRIEQELSAVDTGARAFRRGEAAGRRAG